jgi:isopenicillin N synthase-like dioxygenase
MPVGNYLLVQAGKQLEHITGGLIKAGYHEVVVNDATLEVLMVFVSKCSNINTLSQVIETRKQTHPERPLVRISSTFFWHLSSDFDLQPISSLEQRVGHDEKKQVYEKMFGVPSWSIEN